MRAFCRTKQQTKQHEKKVAHFHLFKNNKNWSKELSE
jgi:hypothetical protein